MAIRSLQRHYSGLAQRYAKARKGKRLDQTIDWFGHKYLQAAIRPMAKNFRGWRGRIVRGPLG